MKNTFPSKSPIHSRGEMQTDVPDNIRYWQVFGNDEQIEDFLQSKNDFECTNIDVDSDDDSVNKQT
jgi:hypothetical protein